MSLIDEALRRAQAAQTPGSGTAQGLRVPMPLPDAGRSRGRAGRVAAAALAAVVLAGAGFFLWRRPRDSRPTQPSSVRAAVPAVPTATPTLIPVEVARPAGGISRPAPSTTRTSTPAPPQTRSAAVPTAAGSAAVPTRSPAASPTSTPAAARREPTRAPAMPPPAEISNASGSPRVAVPEERPRRNEPTPQPTARPKTYVGTANFPSGKLELEGIVYSEANPTALINGNVVRPGGFVDGYSVLRILPDRVELQGDAGTIVLTLK